MTLVEISRAFGGVTMVCGRLGIDAPVGKPRDERLYRLVSRHEFSAVHSTANFEVSRYGASDH
jgi:hypothetical protein